MLEEDSSVLTHLHTNTARGGIQDIDARQPKEGYQTDIEKETLKYQENGGERQTEKRQKLYLLDHLKLVGAAEISIGKKIAHANFIYVSILK